MADLSNGRYSGDEVGDGGVVHDVEMRNEATVHDELALQVVHHAETHSEAHQNVNPVEQACRQLAVLLLAPSVGYCPKEEDHLFTRMSMHTQVPIVSYVMHNVYHLTSLTS